MDVITSKRMEQKQYREAESDYGIGLAEYNYGDKMKLSWLDIINYVYEQTRKGIGKVIIKENFLRDIIDPKISEMNIDLSVMEVNIEMELELERYNYK